MVEPSQTYDLTLIRKDPQHLYELRTATNCIVPITVKGLANLVSIPTGQGARAPNTEELLRFADIALGHGADPYAGECGLLPSWSGGFHYEVWVAAQVRVRKAQSDPTYRGYRWGYITSDGTRHEPGRASKANPNDVVGIWGEVYREGYQEPFYHETWMDEFRKGKDKGSWAQSPIMMLLKVNRDQTHKFAMADRMGNLNTADELRAYDELPPARSEIAPRESRRRPAQDARVIEPTTDESTPAGDTDGGTDPRPAGQEGPAINKPLYAGVVRQFVEAVAEYGQSAGDPSAGIIADMEPAEQAEVFAEYAGWVFSVAPDEVGSAEGFTTAMLVELKRRIEQRGVADWITRVQREADDESQ